MSGRHTAHKPYPSEVTIRYRFHPLCGLTLPVIRLRYVHDEPHYIVRRPNGWSLSFPVWMTQAPAAKIDIVREPQMALSALLELRRLATACLSSLPSSDSEGSQDATARGKTRAPIRGEQFRSPTATPEGGGRASNPRTRALDEGARKDHRRGSGQ